MPKLTYSDNVLNYIDHEVRDVAGTTLREALDNLFALNPKLQGYLLDDQSHVRKHVLMAIDGVILQNKSNLNVPLAPHSEVFIAQALSGG